MEDQNQIIAILAYGMVFVVFLTTVLFVFFYYSRKKIVDKEREKAELKLKNQEEILQATIATQEEERKRIAQDMHDAISSKLNVIGLTANLLLDSDTMADEEKNSLEHILNINNTVLESSRKIAHDLLPPILEKFGLKVALEELVEDYMKASNLQILHQIEPILDLTKMEDLHIFRIVQELMNNALKHAAASQLKIELLPTKNGFKLTFNDNGKGFDPERLDLKMGLGLQNLKSRAAILKCDLAIESSQQGSSFTFKTK